VRVKWTNLGFYLLATVVALLAVYVANYSIGLIYFIGFVAWVLFMIALFVEFERVEDKIQKQQRGVFLKKCVNCNKEIPIASEECQYCGAKQPNR
jgi:cell division protein FtsW (lipid II flippase)